MNKKILSLPIFAFLLLSAEYSFASYNMQIPLEVPQGGALPYNTIIMGVSSSQPTEPVFDVPDPLPTESGVVCEFSLSFPFTAYLEGRAKAGGVWTNYRDAAYRGKSVINAFKGKEMFVDNNETQEITYYEACVKGEPIYATQDNTNPDQGWDQDECRYDIDFEGREYSWNMIPTSDGRLAFTGAYLGSYGNVTTSTNGIIFPAGTLTVPEGKILPDNNQRIIMGGVAFDRGNYYGNRNTGNDTFESNFAVCKKSAK